MKNAKITYAEIILDYFLLEELTKTTTPNDLKRDLDKMNYTYRDIYRYPEKMIDIENDCGAIFTIVYDNNNISLCKEIEYFDSQSVSHFQNIEDFLENLQKTLDKQ